MFGADQGLFTLCQSFDDQSEIEEGGKYHIWFVKAGEDVPKAFQPPERPFDFVAPTIHRAIIFPRAKTIGLGWEDRRDDNFHPVPSVSLALLSPDRY